MKNLNKREKLILMITLGLAVFFVVYQFMIKPLREGGADIDDRLHLQQQQLAKVHQLMSQKDQIEAMYQSLTGLLGTSQPDETQIPVIVAKIETTAHESNIHIVDIQPQKSFKQKEAKFLPVELEIEGQWMDIVRFFYILQQRPNFYFINDLNLEKKADITNSLHGRVVISRMSLS
jgi:Tfp pilus assembly protein PilO